MKLQHDLKTSLQTCYKNNFILQTIKENFEENIYKSCSKRPEMIAISLLGNLHPNYSIESQLLGIPKTKFSFLSENFPKS